MSALTADSNMQHFGPISMGDYPIVPRASSGVIVPSSLPLPPRQSQFQLSNNKSAQKPGKYHTDLLDQDTLLPYLYSFIKSFIGASGTNTVAIDNKIEQAMDLVKSHLMFAVREEVEVLKEKISELMEKINYLETENCILRSHATADTLAQLPQSQQQQQQTSTTPNINGNPSGTNPISSNTAPVTPITNNTNAGAGVVPNGNQTTNP